jgi:hypothetical protein
MGYFKKLYFFLIAGLLLVLLGRSVQYLYRIYTEFRYPEPDKIAAIDVCGPKPAFFNIDSEYLYNYLKLGKICKKP